MAYMPKIVLGRIKGTGLPIDGKAVYLSQWDYDNNEHFYLAAWNDDAEEAVLQTLFATAVEAGMVSTDDTYEDFVDAWKAGEFVPDSTFCFNFENVDVLKTIQNGTHPKAAGGFEIGKRFYQDHIGLG